jgi:hypothetical protein
MIREESIPSLLVVSISHHCCRVGVIEPCSSVMPLCQGKTWITEVSGLLMSKAFSGALEEAKGPEAALEGPEGPGRDLGFCREVSLSLVP